jgi:GTPase SAR1 family protein
LKDLHFNELHGRKALVTGDVCSGKTALTARLLKEAIATVRPTEITLIEMAPRRREFKGVVVGGRLTDLMGDDQSGIRCLLPSRELYAPRVEGTNATHVMSLARSNAESIQELLRIYLRAPTSILFVNDVSIYLQMGDLNRLLEAVSLAGTFVANSYEGPTLEDDQQSGLSKREKAGLAALKNLMDIVLTLQPIKSSQSPGTVAR